LRWLEAHHPGLVIRHEPLSLVLPGGSRYTPDFGVWDSRGSAVLDLYEVKGSYALPSEGRALTALRECAAAFPWARFHLLRERDAKHGGGFTVIEYDQGGWSAV